MRTLFADLAAKPPVELVSRIDHLSLGSATLIRCRFEPNEGLNICPGQLVVSVHEGDSYPLHWRQAGDREWRQHLVQPGECLVNPANTPCRWRWAARPGASIIAIEEEFVNRTLLEAFGTRASHIDLRVGLQDRMIEQMAYLWRHELERGGAGGRVLVDSLAALLVVHLYRNYGSTISRLDRFRGSLGGNRFRRINDFIHANLDRDIRLAELADMAGISMHYFCAAFKRTTGMPPHRYLIARRVHRAKELLLRSEQPIVDIAHAVGFSSQSQLTNHFRKLTGTTPAQFRRNQA